jgi:hypothetical protein
MMAAIIVADQCTEAQTTTSSETKVSTATVKAVDKPANKVEVVTDQGKSLNLHVTDATTIKNGEKKASASDITVGDKVGVTYTKQTAIEIKTLTKKSDIPAPHPIVWPKPKKLETAGQR